MHGTLEKAEAIAQEFSKAQTAWEPVKHEHARAMVVRDLEDLAILGVRALHYWLSVAEEWHAWVSESAERYDAAVHNRIKECEKMIVSATTGAIGLFDYVKPWGYEIIDERRFRELAAQVLAAANPLQDRLGELRAAGDISAHTAAVEPIEVQDILFVEACRGRLSNQARSD